VPQIISKLPENKENGHKVYQMVIKYLNFFLQGPSQNVSKLVVWFEKINHLATVLGVDKMHMVMVLFLLHMYININDKEKA
jgi:hypothetical protein